MLNSQIKYRTLGDTAQYENKKWELVEPAVAELVYINTYNVAQLLATYMKEGKYTKYVLCNYNPLYGYEKDKAIVPTGATKWKTNHIYYGASLMCVANILRGYSLVNLNYELALFEYGGQSEDIKKWYKKLYDDKDGITRLVSMRKKYKIDYDNRMYVSSDQIDDIMTKSEEYLKIIKSFMCEYDLKPLDELLKTEKTDIIWMQIDKQKDDLRRYLVSGDPGDDLYRTIACNVVRDYVL